MYFPSTGTTDANNTVRAILKSSFLLIQSCYNFRTSF